MTILRKWDGSDLNRRPSALQADAATRLSYHPMFFQLFVRYLIQWAFLFYSLIESGTSILIARKSIDHPVEREYLIVPTFALQAYISFTKRYVCFHNVLSKQFVGSLSDELSIGGAEVAFVVMSYLCHVLHPIPTFCRNSICKRKRPRLSSGPLELRGSLFYGLPGQRAKANGPSIREKLRGDDGLTLHCGSLPFRFPYRIDAGRGHDRYSSDCTLRFLLRPRWIQGFFANEGARSRRTIGSHGDSVGKNRGFCSFVDGAFGSRISSLWMP